MVEQNQVNCKRCGEQLNYDDGFEEKYCLCEKCFNIVKFDNPEKLEELLEESLKE